MGRFLLRRLISLVVTIVLVSLGVFFISELAPGDLARNVLGHQITEDQAASFKAQHGLDQPPVTRYIRWLIGSDWQASRLIGRSLQRVYDPETKQYTWWVVGENDELYQNYSPGGDKMIKVIRQPDGKTIEEEMGDNIWILDEDGIPVYWGVDTLGRAAMWVRGDKLEVWVITKSAWGTVPGAPRQYIPLQKGLLRGDPGVSFFTHRPIAETLIRRLKNTAILAGIAFAFIMPIALVFGLIAGVNEGKPIDRLLSISSLIATATPEFASGVFLIMVFAIWLKILPGGVVFSSDTAILDNPKMLVLPLMTLTLAEVGYVLRITRASMVGVMEQDYIRTAFLKGLPRWRIIFKHALRNTLMAPITVIMLHVNWLVGGIVVVESIFGFPGVGRYVYDAALFSDVFAVEAATMTLVVIAVVTQLLADIIYTYLNPRIGYA